MEFKEVPQKERRKMINIKHGLFPDVRDDMKNDMTVQIFSMPKMHFLNDKVKKYVVEVMSGKVHLRKI